MESFSWTKNRKKNRERIREKERGKERERDGVGSLVCFWSHPKEPKHDDAEDDADEDEDGDIDEDAGGHSILPATNFESTLPTTIPNQVCQIWSSQIGIFETPNMVITSYGL